MRSTKRPATMLALSFVAVGFCGLSALHAQSAGGGPVVAGSPNVIVDGSSAARQGDAIAGGDAATQGSSNVFINGKPAVMAGGKTACGGAIVTGSATVFVNGKPLARRGDPATGCPKP